MWSVERLPAPALDERKLSNADWSAARADAGDVEGVGDTDSTITSLLKALRAKQARRYPR